MLVDCEVRGCVGRLCGERVCWKIVCVESALRKCVERLYW